MDIFLAGLEKYEILIDLVLAVCSLATTVLLIVQTSRISKRQDKVSLYNTREEYYDLICEIESCIKTISVYAEDIERILRNINSFYSVRKTWKNTLDKNKDLKKTEVLFNSVSQINICGIMLDCMVLSIELDHIEDHYYNTELRNNGCFEKSVEHLRRYCDSLKEEIDIAKKEMLKELSLTK